ncbi:MAG: zinc ribbon domain-containing protein [Deltaproteobacteria bacterium]|nr:zinc ribbon domain-containing protein [Deltaproteobacteria bacterium]
MPIYEYQCPSCGVTFEKQQSITANPIKTCPECGGRKVQRLISSTSFVLKGSGWYVTDYGKGGSGPAKDKEKSKEKDSSSKSDGGSSTGSTSTATASDSKPSTAPEKSSTTKPAPASS